MFIKICGITRTEDAKKAIQCGVSALGFIAYPKSNRFINASQTGLLCDFVKNEISGKILRVGVFVDAPIKEIKKYVGAGINVIQLHGEESKETILNIRNLFGSQICEIWKAIRPQSESEIDDFLTYPADKFLIDTFCKNKPGGTGKTADWELAKYAVNNLPRPVILAGGLSAQNLDKAIKTVMPYGIDASSGVESRPGIKEHRLVEAFIEKARTIQ